MPLIRILILLAFTLVPHSARADSWATAEQSVTLSGDGNWRLSVVPAEVKSRLDYFAGRHEGQAAARLERRQTEGWRHIWSRNLLNPVTPVEVLISASGHVVTFDDWYAAGTSRNTVVIYAPDGTLIRRMSLGDMVGDVYMMTFPHSVSSIMWRNSAMVDETSGTVVITLASPSDLERLKSYAAKSGQHPPARLVIRLRDGLVLRTPGTAVLPKAGPP